MLVNAVRRKADDFNIVWIITSQKVMLFIEEVRNFLAYSAI
jgi:hypothetical protein